MLFLIVGPSGSGKDTLIDYVTKRLPVKRVKRVITRELNEYEDFNSVSVDDFNTMDFLITWESYGKKYGIPLLGSGDYIINVSRKVVDELRSKTDVKVVELTASKEVLIERVNRRVRDSINEKKERINRVVEVNSDFIIDTSSSDISIAGEELVNYLKNFI